MARSIALASEGRVPYRFPKFLTGTTRLSVDRDPIKLADVLRALRGLFVAKA